MAKDIVSRFLGESAPEQVNLDSASVRVTLERYKSNTFAVDIFAPALKVALGNMEWDSARHFINSQHYKGSVCFPFFLNKARCPGK
jgi:hypothetical protein